MDNFEEDLKDKIRTWILELQREVKGSEKWTLIVRSHCEHT